MPLWKRSNLPAPLIATYQEIVSELADCRNPGYGEADGAYWSTLHILESFPQELVDPELVSAIKAGMAWPCQWAGYMLGRRRCQRAVPALIGLLKHEKPLVRASAVLALATIGDPGAYEAVAALRDDPAVEVRNEVRRAVGQWQAES